MGFPISSSVFNGLTARLVANGLSDVQLERIVSLIDRSRIFSRRIREFEEAGGQIEYEDTAKNYYWNNKGVPTVYVSPAYKNGGEHPPDVDELAKVIAHEMSHFETYEKEKFSTNNAADEDDCGAAGCRDEARAYALEYLVECEINRIEPVVTWTDEDQATLAQRAIDALPGGARTEQAMLDSATLKLLDWAANWTGGTIDAGGYFQFYKNHWRTHLKPPQEAVTLRDIAMRCDPQGNINEIDYTMENGSKTALVLDPGSGKFFKKS